MLIEVLLFILFFRQSFCPIEAMEFRKKIWKHFFALHFLSFYHLRKPANEQNRFVVDELSKELRNEGICYLLGAHIYHCLRQCCFNDDTTCLSSHCEEQSGEKRYGLCPVINPPTSLDATSNHIYLLISCNNAPQSSTFARNACETRGVNWTPEGAVQTVNVFWETFVYGGSQWFPVNSKTSVVFLLTFCRLLFLP